VPYRLLVANGIRIQGDEEFSRRVDRYRRQPWLMSASSAIIVGIIVGSSRSWLSGAIAAVVLFIALRFVIGPYTLRMSNRASTDRAASDDANPFR
jgi:hypothetical protein